MTDAEAKIEEALENLDAASEMLAALSKMNVPEGKIIAAKWIQDEGFDKAVGGVTGLSYKTAARKADRQRMVPIAAVLKVLGEMEDELVKASVLGPWRSAVKQVSGPIRSARRAAAFVETLAEAEWSNLLDEGKKAVKVWGALKGTITQKVAQFAGPFADQATGLVKRATDAVEDPRTIATGLLLAVAGAMTVAAIRKQLKGAVKAKETAIEAVKARAFPQRRVARRYVHRRTRS